MRMRFPMFLTALLLGAAAAVVVGCGDRSGLIPPTSADQLKRHIDAVASAVAQGDCDRTAARLEQVRSDVSNLSQEGVDRRLVRNLRDNVSRLSAQAGQDCAAPPPTDTTPTETVPTQTTTTQTQTQTTETTTTPTTTSTTPTTTTTTPTTPTTPTTTAPGGTGGIGPDGGTSQGPGPGGG